jgi:thiamine-phosphate pyrophosphorylase
VPSLPKLYAILDLDALTARGLSSVRAGDVCQAWLDAGVRLVQLRAKTCAAGAMLTLADDLAARVHAAGGIFIVNDRADVARAAGADGVHLGQDDLPAAGAAGLGLRVIGVSTHNAAQLETALAGPATYVAIGPVFATVSKERPDPVVGLDGVRTAAARLAADARPGGPPPLVAIGGITVADAAAVLAAGAASVAVISGLLAGDPGKRAGEYLRALGA